MRVDHARGRLRTILLFVAALTARAGAEAPRAAHGVEPGECAAALPAPVDARWQALGGAAGSLGCALDPGSETRSSAGARAHVVDFAGQRAGPVALVLVLDGPRAGRVIALGGAALEAWTSLGRSGSWLGLPLTESITTPDGIRTDFEGGYLVCVAGAPYCDGWRHGAAAGAPAVARVALTGQPPPRVPPTPAPPERPSPAPAPPPTPPPITEPRPADVREPARAPLAPPSADQETVLRAFGAPEGFSITFVRDETAGVVSRDEVWIYPSVATSFTFFDGALVTSSAIEPIDRPLVSAPWNPASFRAGMTFDEIAASAGGERAWVGLDVVEELLPGGKIYVTEQLVLGFLDDALALVEAQPLVGAGDAPAEGGGAGDKP